MDCEHWYISAFVYEFIHRTFLFCFLSSMASCSHYNSFLLALAVYNMDLPHYFRNFGILSCSSHEFRRNYDNIIVRGNLIFTHPGFLPCDILFIEETKREVFQKTRCQRSSLKNNENSITKREAISSHHSYSVFYFKFYSSTKFNSFDCSWYLSAIQQPERSIQYLNGFPKF